MSEPRCRPLSVDFAPVRLAGFAGASVGRVSAVLSSLDAEHAALVSTAGIIRGARVQVIATDDQSVHVWAPRGELVVGLEVARSVLVVPGDLAAISDEVVRGHR